jgi:hypothetical protein
MAFRAEMTFLTVPSLLPTYSAISTLVRGRFSELYIYDGEEYLVEALRNVHAITIN